MFIDTDGRRLTQMESGLSVSYEKYLVQHADDDLKVL